MHFAGAAQKQTPNSPSDMLGRVAHVENKETVGCHSSVMYAWTCLQPSKRFTSGKFLFARVVQLHRAKRLHKAYKQLCMHIKHITTCSNKPGRACCQGCCCMYCAILHMHAQLLVSLQGPKKLPNHDTLTRCLPHKSNLEYTLNP